MSAGEIKLNQIINCYDSHTHFFASGEVALGMKLQTLQSAEDIRKIIIKPTYFRDNWITGFGWDQNIWPNKALPNKEILDRIFPNQPVYFSRVDGHVGWMNSYAIKVLTEKGFDFNQTIQGGMIERNAQMGLTGLLFEQAHIKALSYLPDYSDSQKKLFLLEAQRLFNEAGFTHVRDLSMNLNLWKILIQIYNERKLSICLDAFVTAEDLNDLDRVLTEIEEMKKNPCEFLRIHGVKIFVDGSLGSKTAYLSKNYNKADSQGVFSWIKSELTTLIKKVWSSNLDLAVHTIGDEAVHQVVIAAREVSAQGFLGRLHLEHVEILRPETVQLMKPLHVICHMQPCHWLSDEKWLKDILPETLNKFIFQWELLRKNQVPFYFGSDSPVEPISLFRNQEALIKSAKDQVPQLRSDWKTHHSHPDKNWSDSWTKFDQNQITEVYFNKTIVFKK